MTSSSHGLGPAPPALTLHDCCRPCFKDFTHRISLQRHREVLHLAWQDRLLVIPAQPFESAPGLFCKRAAALGNARLTPPSLLSCRYPTNKWVKLGTFHARDERIVQSFPLDEQLYAKYVKVLPLPPLTARTVHLWLQDRKEGQLSNSWIHSDTWAEALNSRDLLMTSWWINDCQGVSSWQCLLQELKSSYMCFSLSHRR